MGEDTGVIKLSGGAAPVTLLVFAGAFNGLIPPIGFTPVWLLGVGVVAWLLTLYLGYQSLGGLAKL